MYDVSVAPASATISDAFKYSHLVFASATYNAGVFVTMEALLHDLAAHSLKNRTIGFIQNGSWAASSGKLMREILAKLPNTTFIEDIPYVKSSVKEDSLVSITALANRIAEDFPAKEEVAVRSTARLCISFRTVFLRSLPTTASATMLVS